MDDELKNLEAELKRLHPSPPSPVLVARVERALAEAPARRGLADVHWLWVAALPAAAAIALLFTSASSERGVVAPAEALAGTAGSAAASVAEEQPLKPVAAENILVSAADEGFVTLRDGTPARRERLQYVDTITWKNPRTNASLTWRVPREEVRVVPVSFQ